MSHYQLLILIVRTTLEFCFCLTALGLLRMLSLFPALLKKKKKIGIIIDGDKYVKHLVNIQRTVVE